MFGKMMSRFECEESDYSEWEYPRNWSSFFQHLAHGDCQWLLHDAVQYFRNRNSTFFFGVEFDDWEWFLRLQLF
jgi:hypothetical protein